ncbi:MAG: dTDP-4-dehydrorhamnose reductase [Deltaproteobacteria bacterium]|nr:MAG: dTDP-4-dehydrorhamnose reductase [Deltaproteobacteria bacterium]
MKLLVIGANGQLGWALGEKGKKSGFNLERVDLPDFNITDKVNVSRQVEKSDPDLVINASAYTAVDKAESESELAFAVNAKGPAYLAEACATRGIPMIHVSTDYVFDGEKKTPYLESDPVSPLGVYGKSKAAGDDAIRNQLSSHVIIRTAWLYGTHGQNFVKTMLRLGKERKALRVVADQHGCPTYAADLADAILIISRHILNGSHDQWGTYHYCGQGSTTWHGFAEEIFNIAGTLIPLKVRKTEPVSTDDYPTPTRRPANSVLDCRRIREKFGIRTRPWKESLAEMLKILLSGEGRLDV